MITYFSKKYSSCGSRRSPAAFFFGAFREYTPPNASNASGSATSGPSFANAAFSFSFAACSALSRAHVSANPGVLLNSAMNPWRSYDRSSSMETPSTSNGNGFGAFRADDVSDAETRTAPSDTRHPANASFSFSFSSASSDAFDGIPFPVSPVSPVSPGRAIGPERGNRRARSRTLSPRILVFESPWRSPPRRRPRPAPPPGSGRRERRAAARPSLCPSRATARTHPYRRLVVRVFRLLEARPSRERPSLSGKAFPDDDPIDPERRRRRLRSCSAAKSRALKLTPTYRPCSGVIRSITPYCPPGSSSVSPRPHHHPTKPAPRSRKSAAAA